MVFNLLDAVLNLIRGIIGSIIGCPTPPTPPTPPVPPDFPPIAVGDQYAASSAFTLEIPAPGVLLNDVDLNNLPLTAQLVSGPSHGTLTFNSDGSFTYTPDSGFLGMDTFTYQASNGIALSNIATVNINVY